MNCLLGLCQTDAERKFLRIYYETAFGGWIEPQEGWFIWADLIQTRVADLDEWWTRQSEIPPKFRDPANVSLSILRGLNAPVLLPQLWLSYEFGNQARESSPVIE
jgi:hypothetical protein